MKRKYISSYFYISPKTKNTELICYLLGLLEGAKVGELVGLFEGVRVGELDDKLVGVEDGGLVVGFAVEVGVKGDDEGDIEGVVVPEIVGKSNASKI